MVTLNLASCLLHKADIKIPFTRYSRLSRFDNRVEQTATVHSTSCHTGLYNWFDNRLYTRYSQLSNRLSIGFDNWLNVCIHDTTGCQTGLTQYNRFDNRLDNRLYRVYKHLPGCQTTLATSLTTGCIV